MQDRHSDRNRYFNELSETCEKYFLPYIQKFKDIGPESNILEIGCGEGGNLAPFSKIGCHVYGIDISVNRIKQARIFFAERGLSGEFSNVDIFKTEELKALYDVIIIHDVIEHIHNKQSFINIAKRFMKTDGIIFIGFPAWQMPFGGHQQIVENKNISKMPFIHLLPNPIYVSLLKAFSIKKERINELLDIKACKINIESFRRLIKTSRLRIVNEQMYFINPHYETKFKLKPRKLPSVLSKIPYLRNFLTTSVLYIIKK